MISDYSKYGPHQSAMKELQLLVLLHLRVHLISPTPLETKKSVRLLLWGACVTVSQWANGLPHAQGGRAT